MSSRRSVGFSGYNPISMMDISAYLEVYPTEDRQLFIYLINAMDMEYLSDSPTAIEDTENTDDG